MTIYNPLYKASEEGDKFLTGDAEGNFCLLLNLQRLEPTNSCKNNVKLKISFNIITTQTGSKYLLIAPEHDAQFRLCKLHCCGHVLCKSKWILADVILSESSCESILGFRSKFSPADAKIFRFT